MIRANRRRKPAIAPINIATVYWTIWSRINCRRGIVVTRNLNLTRAQWIAVMRIRRLPAIGGLICLNYSLFWQLLGSFDRQFPCTSNPQPIYTFTADIIAVAPTRPYPPVRTFRFAPSPKSSSGSSLKRSPSQNHRRRNGHCLRPAPRRRHHRISQRTNSRKRRASPCDSTISWR